jgi:hypothetical protein
VTESLNRKLVQLRDELNLLPEATEPPSTTLHIIRNNQQEQDWQRLFFHYLSPKEPHGLGHTLLEHILSALSDRDDLGFTFSRFDLPEIQNEQEVLIPNGRQPDAVTWASEDWFICWELKIDASEGENQTQDYADADEFQSIDLAKDDVPADDHYYIYLAPDEADPPDSDAFVPVSWKWIASELQSFLSESQGEYPARTTTQLETFIGTIRSELTMTDYQENQQEKVELYLDYYDEISDVQRAFEEQWEEFINTWGNKLAQTLDTATISDDPDVPDKYVSIELTMGNDESRLWTLRQGHANWGWMFPRQWWTKLDENQPIFDNESPMARVGFLHQPGRNREDALRDHELMFYLRNAPTANDDFHEGFHTRFNNDSNVSDELPPKTTRPELEQNVLKSSYEINSNDRDDFFESYIAALARAIDEHIVSNPELVNEIDKIYQQTIEEDTQF